MGGSSFLVRKVLKVHPAIDMALDATSLICLVQVRSLDMYTPRSLMYSLSFITSPLGSVYECLSIFKLLPILWCSEFGHSYDRNLHKSNSLYDHYRDERISRVI